MLPIVVTQGLLLRINVTLGIVFLGGIWEVILEMGLQVTGNGWDDLWAFQDLTPQVLGGAGPLPLWQPL